MARKSSRVVVKVPNAVSDVRIETGWIQLYGGEKFFPSKPYWFPGMLRAIARGLAAENRYCGATDQLYSVAQHSVIAAMIVDPEFARAALFHDAPEGLGLKDWPRPIKETMPAAVREWYQESERLIIQMLADHYGFDSMWSDHFVKAVKAADEMLLVTESRDLFSKLHTDWHFQTRNGYLALPFKVDPWPWTVAEALFVWSYGFLSRFSLSADSMLSEFSKVKEIMMSAVSEKACLSVVDPNGVLIGIVADCLSMSLDDLLRL